jgi:DNA-binding response OmpR family regulator
MPRRNAPTPPHAHLESRGSMHAPSLDFPLESAAAPLGHAHAAPPEGRYSHHVLVVDDDVELCRMLREYLQPEGFDVETRHAPTEGLEAALRGKHDLIILDVMLGAANGLELLRNLRSQKNTPVIMLTAKGDDVDRIIGLELGADDYLGKPFNPRELAARIRAVLRRVAQTTSTEETPAQLTIHDLDMDLTRRRVSLAGVTLPLTGIEFEILKTLAENIGKVVARDVIYTRVFRRDMYPLDRSLNVHVSNLRRKIADATGQPDRIKTVHGVGYLFAPPL